LHSDPQLVALSSVKLAQPFCFLRRILGTSRENIRGEPFHGSIAKTARAPGPISNLKPLQCIEEKRTVTWRVDDGLSLGEGGGASRREVELVEKGNLKGQIVERAVKLLALLNDLMANYQTLRRRISPAG
jgi:hypothetical protein